MTSISITTTQVEQSRKRIRLGGSYRERRSKPFYSLEVTTPSLSLRLRGTPVWSDDDQLLTRPDQVFSITCGTPELVALRNQLKSIVLPLLAPLPCDYSLVFLRQGNSEENSVPVLFVYLRNIVHVHSIEKQIERQFQNNIKVKLGKMEPTTVQRVTAADANPRIGFSIASLGSSSAGSLGCFLKSVSDDKVYALTCAHVV